MTDDYVITGDGPDPTEDASVWWTKPPRGGCVGHRRADDLNKELADDLRGRVAVVIGRTLIRVLDDRC